MKIYQSISELVGHTPLLNLKRYAAVNNVQATLLGKLEYLNPAGSAKDRVAREIIAQAEADGTLKPGSVMIEPTSGNTGIGLAAIAASKGYRVIITMPETMSAERRALLKAYGAELVLTDGGAGMAGSIAKAEELVHCTPNAVLGGQFTNPANPDAHRKTTGPEIWADTDGTVAVFVAGIGTGGTITGVGEYLKAQNPHVTVVGVEPSGSPFLTKGVAGPHGLQGIGAGFIPEILNTDSYDEVLTVPDEAAYETGRAIATTEGILVGITSGAAVWAAKELALRPENRDKVIVALLPDTGDRYLSTPMFAE